VVGVDKNRQATGEHVLAWGLATHAEVQKIGYEALYKNIK
jgi:hypothetical protein